MPIPRFVPFIETVLMQQLHDRWFAAYEHHASILTHTICDKPCKLRQRAQMAHALQNAVNNGIYLCQALVLRCDCTEELVDATTREYLGTLGLTGDLFHEDVRQRIARDNLWGFADNESPVFETEFSAN